MASLKTGILAPSSVGLARHRRGVLSHGLTLSRGGACGVSTSGRCPLPGSSPCPAAARLPSRQVRVVVCAADEEAPVKYNKEFGYSRKDIIIITFGLIALGYVMYYGLQALGMEAGMAGNWVQLIIFLGICIGYVSTYIFRVATKQMTYVKQLEAYEEAVMKKRIEEMTEDELAELMKEADQEKARKAARQQMMMQQREQQQQGKQ